MTKKKNTLWYKQVYFVLGILIVSLALYNVVNVTQLSSTVSEKLIELEKELRLPEITITSVVESDCPLCTSTDTIVDFIKNAAVNITEEKNVERSDASDLIAQYQLDTVPTIIITGEIEDLDIDGFTMVDDALVLSRHTPPYVSAEGEVQGMVTATIISDSSCTECVDVSYLISALQQSGIMVEETITLDRNQASNQIKTYGIETLPQVILSDDLQLYKDAPALQNWDQIGIINDDGSYVTTFTAPPYVSVASGEVKGLVKMTILSDESCTDCYDPNTFHTPILQRMGVAFSEELTIDINTPKGKELLSTYEIDQIPTVILEGDVDLYPVLVQAWLEVGSAESDGAYVFRNVAVTRQVYRNVTTNV